MQLAVDARGLRKGFPSGTRLTRLLRRQARKEVDVFGGLDLQVELGEVLGVVGQNGSGKSTLLKMISSLLLPDGGTLEVLGVPAAQANAAFRRRVSYIPADERSFSWRLTGRQNLRFFAALYGLRGTEAANRVDSTLDQVGLVAHAERPVREYSSGMRQRLSLARGLLGTPELLLFDEPTRAVDRQGAQQLWRFLARELLPGRTALVATHDPAEVETLCTRVVVIGAGRVLTTGSPQQVEQLLAPAAAAP